MGKSVLQDWVLELSFMQQSVLITATRGPDGIKKDHVAKLLIRWLRRCYLLSAFDGIAIDNPYQNGGCSFTGPSINLSSLYKETWDHFMDEVVLDYLRTVDELPHHFQLHFMHAAEILGYKHPTEKTREWWHKTYLTLVNDMHLFPESEEQMDKRLGYSEQNWREAEKVTAKNPK